MANLLKLFDEALSQGNKLALESAVQGNQIATDLESVIENFKKIKAELARKEPDNVLFMAKVNQGLADAENLLQLMRDSMPSRDQNTMLVNRP